MRSRCWPFVRPDTHVEAIFLIVWTARAPGKWLLHCHINHHITNNGAEANGGGGLTKVINVTA